MFDYTPTKNLNDSINITNAKIIEGKFDWIEGQYRRVTWGTDTRMLKIKFESLDDSITLLYVSNNDFSQDFQHTTELDQRSFFFPLKEAPLDQLRIYGVKIDEEKSNAKLRPVGEVIGKSKLIQECLLENQKVIKENNSLITQSLFAKKEEINTAPNTPNYCNSSGPDLIRSHPEC